MVKETMKRQFFFGLAGFVFPDQIHGLLRYVDTSQLLYGSDYPYTLPESVVKLANQMDQEMTWLFKDNESVMTVYRLNAQRLLGKSRIS